MDAFASSSPEWGSLELAIVRHPVRQHADLTVTLGTSGRHALAFDADELALYIAQGQAGDASCLAEPSWRA